MDGYARPSDHPVKSLSQPLNVLIVDDDELIVEALALLVESIGCRVTTACDGMAALKLLGDVAFDVLLTDWQMPNLDGIALVQLCRRERRDNYLHVIMMTTRASERSVSDGLKAEVDDFLFKPVDPVFVALALASARRSVDLQRRLARRNRHLIAANKRARAAYRRISDDLEAAVATQRSLLPNMQMQGPLRHGWLFIPSLGIGGDSLDVCVLPDGRRFFFQIDVSGHGIPAALRSFSLHHRLSARPPVSADNMQAMIHALNRDAQDEAEGAYYTMVCGLVSGDGSHAEIIRAGHPMPILLHNGTARLLDAGSPPVGLLPNLTYSATHIDLAPGDRLIFHSDGIADCCDPAEQVFGEARFIAFLESHADCPLAELIECLETELRTFRGIRDFDDDVSLLILERAAGE